MDEYYEKRPGGAGLHGVEYQLEVITLCLLKAYESQKDFKISSEYIKDGKMDDVVLIDEDHVILAQCKHKQNECDKVSFEALLSETHELSLIPLLKSFNIIYLERLQELNKSIQQLQRGDSIAELKNCSNEVLKAFNDCSHNHENLIQVLISTVREQKNELLNTKVDWFEQYILHLITNVEIHPGVAQKLSIDKTNEDNGFSYYGGGEVYYKFNHEDISKNYSSNEQNKESLIFFMKYFFSRFKLVTIKESTLRKNIESTIGKLDLFNKGHWDFDSVYSYIRKRIKEWYNYYRGNDGYVLKRMHLEVFFSDFWSKSYVKELREFENKFDFKINDLEVEINKSQITLVKSPRYFLLMVKLQEHWYDQIDKAQVLFLNPYEDIALQKYLTKSFKYHKYTHYLCPLLENRNHELEATIKEVLLEVKEKKYKKIILFSEMDLLSLSNTGTINTISDQHLYSNLKITGVRRLKSLGDIENYYVARNFTHKYDWISEDKFLDKLIQNKDKKFTLIIDGPGMGKTTLLTNLTCRINRMDNLWAINIQLNRCTSILNEFMKFRNLNIEDLLAFSSNSTMQDIVESQIFTVPNVVYLMIDAVDEVSPKYTNIVLNCLKNSSNKVAKIVVTAREHMKTKLSESLEVTPYTMTMFSPKEQKKFIMSFWIKNLRLRDQNLIEKCEAYSEKLLKHFEFSFVNSFWKFIGVPLQTRMVAEIFVRGVSTEITGCQEFLKKSENEISLPVNMSLGKLYDLFLERKREIYIDEKCNVQGNVNAEESLEREFEEYVKVCKRVAIRIIINKKFWFHFNITNELLNIHGEYLYRIGLLILPTEKLSFIRNDSSSEDSDAASNELRPQFIHKSFAEYFAAKVICEKLFHNINSDSEHFAKFLISEVFLKRAQVVVHQFIECDLKNYWGDIDSAVLKLFSAVLETTVMNADDNLSLLASRGCLYVLKLLLDASQTPKEWVNDIYDDHKTNILLESIKNIDIVKLLVSHGADVNLKGLFDKTPLHFAAENGYLNVVEYLVDHVDNIDTVTEAGLTPLHEAIFNNHMQVVKCLIDKGASITKRTGGGWTCLHYAALLKNQDLMEMVLEKGVDINEKTTKTLPGCTALHIAIERKYYDICDSLFRRGININLKDDLGRGIWSFAVIAGNEACKFVKSKRQEYDIEKDSEALVIAIDAGSLDMVEYLLESDFDINLANKEGWNPLQYAIIERYYDICKSLLERGANDKIKTVDGRTILHLAASTGKLKLFQLVEKNQQLTEKTSEGMTILHLAAKSGELELFEYIYVKLDTNMRSARSLDGRTILHYAAMGRDLDLFKYAEEKANVSLDTTANDGKNMLHEAVSSGSLEIIVHVIKSLQDKRIDLNFKSKDGSLILYRPNYKYVDEITEKLEEAGVKKETIGDPERNI